MNVIGVGPVQYFADQGTHFTLMNDAAEFVRLHRILGRFQQLVVGPQYDVRGVRV